MLTEDEFTSVFLDFGFAQESAAPCRDDLLCFFRYPPQAREQGVLAVASFSALRPPMRRGQSQVYPILLRMHPSHEWGTSEDLPCLRRFTPNTPDALARRIEVVLRVREQWGVEELLKWYGTQYERPELRSARELVEAAQSPYTDVRRSAELVLRDWLYENGIPF